MHNIWLKTLKYESGTVGDKIEKEKMNAPDIQRTNYLYKIGLGGLFSL